MGGAILVVEDEPAIQELIAVNLEHAGHQVLRAANVSEAEALVREVLPDLVLLDWMLPGLPGVNFARQLRADQRTKDIPIIMLTAAAGAGHDRRPGERRGRLRHQTGSRRGNFWRVSKR